LGYRYSLSLRWLFLHEQHDAGVLMGNTAENMLDSLILLISFILTSYFVGMCTNLVITWSNSHARQLAMVARRYMVRHKVSPKLSYRVETVLLSSQLEGPSEVLAEEQLLKAALPTRLHVDLNYEARHHIVCNLQLFSLMHEWSPRVLRALTHYTLSEMVAVQDESLFAKGDACSHAIFITSGHFIYQCDEHILMSTPRLRDRRKSIEGEDFLEKGDVLSEAALWTPWEHRGTLTSSTDSILLAMEAANLPKVIMDYRYAAIHAVKHAKHFCWRLNRVASCDLTGFDLSLESLDVDLCIGGPEDHFAFISHYKVEAGTEATLVRDELEILVRKDPANVAGDFKSPVFIDSEDLIDLTRLIDHVRGSLALILLLTPGLLSRPYCLLEIVTAKRTARPFVPVLLSRPGLQYQFPDEEFYEKLHRDEIIAGGAEGRKLLEENGTNLKEVEEAIRSIFKMIALPYSPHKSTNIREAEISDIFKRCMTLTAESLQDIHNRQLQLTDNPRLSGKSSDDMELLSAELLNP